MFGSDFIVIKDNRGFEIGFFWSDVYQILGVYEDDNWVRVKFRNDYKGYYSLACNMSVHEFLEQVEKQLGAGIPDPSYITPGQVTITPLSNPYPDGPADQIVSD